MQLFLTKGLAETAALWSDVKQGYTRVHRAAHILSNDEQHTAAQVRQTYETLLTEMEQTPTASERLATMLSTFRKVTTSYWPGLFHCYDHAALPRTNNALEQYFGSARYHERRAGGRKQASPGVVVRGAVRVVASIDSRLHPLSGAELCPPDLTRWRTLRRELSHRHEARRMQRRFRNARSRPVASRSGKSKHPEACTRGKATPGERVVWKNEALPHPQREDKTRADRNVSACARFFLLD
jgi:hypothetical protein